MGEANLVIEEQIDRTLRYLNKIIRSQGYPNIYFTASTGSKINSIIALRYVPESIPCIGNISTPCRDHYSNDTGDAKNRGRISSSKEIIQMKEDYDTDLVVLLREQHSANSPNHDGSSIQLNTHNLSRAFRAVAVAKLYEDDPDVEDKFPQLENIIHEIGHLLGADHSRFNVTPGQQNNKGLATTFVHTTGCSTYHEHGLRTIMTYQDVCNDATDWRQKWPAKCGPVGACFASRKFSAANQHDIVNKQPVSIGHTQANNIVYIAGYAPTVAQYSDHIKINRSPVAVIQIDQFPDYQAGDVITVGKGSTLNFDGGGSYDPNGDPVSYRWSLYSGKRHIASYKTQKVDYIFSDAGDYTMFLSAHDGHPGLYPRREFVDIKVVKDKLNAPILKIFETLSKHRNPKLKWNKISGAQQYRIHRKINDGVWQWHLSTSNLEYKINYPALNKGSTYHYRVFACADNSDNKCSLSSNIKSLLVK